jgi:CheY-like chemotaxis protein
VSPAVALATLGRGAFAAFQGAGAAALFAIEALSHLLRPPFHGKLFLRQLVEIGFFSLPVVALTAGAFEEDRQHCIDVGMDGFLAKPLKVSELTAVLKKWILGGRDTLQ